MKRRGPQRTGAGGAAASAAPGGGRRRAPRAGKVQTAAQAADQRWMEVALRLAARGRGRTSPNPMVGAVVVKAGRLLAGGFHARAGEDHAEVAALRRLRFSAAGATLYVTLEPCCHVGRTGPCTEPIIASGIRRVVVGCRDPNPRVDGRGIAILRRAGVRVDVGVREAACVEANRPFFSWVKRGRPLVTLKAAMTADGFIAAADGSSTWITNERSRRLAHELRAQHDAVLVGAGTVLADDPRLTVRLPGRRWAGRTPLRVVLDNRLRTPPGARIVAERAGAATLIVAGEHAPAAKARALEMAGAEVMRLAAPGGRPPLAAILAALARKGVQSLLVEGGAAVHGAFIDARLVDRVALFVAPRLLGRGVPVAGGGGLTLDEALRLGPLRARSLDGDILLTADVAVGEG